MRPHYAPKLLQPVPAGSKLYVGCGEDSIEGYVGCDLRALENVSLACRAWDVSKHCQGLSEIYSRHMLEHLTLEESEITLQDWKQALAPGGVVRIEVPNLEFAIEQWRRAKWSNADLENRYSDARWGFAGFFGWQRECDPAAEDYDPNYWDVHKSGYTPESMRFFLEKAGFESIDIRLDGFTAKQNRRRKLKPEASAGCHLIATAMKPITENSGDADLETTKQSEPHLRRAG